VIPLSPAAVPRVAPKARLQWDRVRGRHVLLYPEGLVTLSATAQDVLRLCDGGHTVAEIVAALKRRYRGDDIERDVVALVQKLGDKGLLRWW